MPEAFISEAIRTARGKGKNGGLPGLVDRAREFAHRYDERFTPPKSLVDKAARGEVYE